MVKQRVTNITSMPQSIEEERRARMRKYAIMMGIRVVCFLTLIWVRGWWMFIFAAGAIFLPYFAVVIANAVQMRRIGAVERPNVIEPLYPPTEWFAAGGDAGSRGGDATGPDAPGRGHDEHGRRAS